MDQKRVLDHICNMQKEHIDATTVGRLISEVRQDIKDEILQEKQLKDHLLYEKGDPLLDNLDSEG